MATYVLVHGAWMGKAAWDLLAPRLEAAGHRAITLDLPAHGADATPAAAAALDGYRDAVIGAIGSARGVVLVGHSMGGMVISAVAERIPEQLQSLVYLCAYLPRSGESLYALSQEDGGSRVGRYWRQEDPARYTPAWIAPEGIVEVFGADCPPALQQLLVEKHHPEPVPPLATPVTLSAERYGRVPRIYIETLNDACVSHQLQQLMIERVGVQARYPLETGHTPFYSAPDALAAVLLGLAEPS